MVSSLTGERASEISATQAWPRRGPRARRLAGIDVALGLLAAAVALILGPGLGVVAVVALLLIAVCLIPPVARRARPRRRSARPRGPRRGSRAL